MAHDPQETDPNESDETDVEDGAFFTAPPAESALDRLVITLDECTSKGLFPIVAYGYEGDRFSVVTTRVNRLPEAIQALGDTLNERYNLGRSIYLNRLERLASANQSLVRLHTCTIRGVGEMDLRSVGNAVKCFGAPMIDQKGFALVDIVGFSKLEPPQQLAQLYSLQNLIRTQIGRVWGHFFPRLNLTGRFCSASTGDGAYLWHSLHGGNADVATLMLLVCILAQAEQLRTQGAKMQLKASYVIDSAFLLFSPDDAKKRFPLPVNAIGHGTNEASRLVGCCQPGQFLIKDFRRSGQGNEQLTPEIVLRQINELFRAENNGAATLKLDPASAVRASDKHGLYRYCFNVCGDIPHEVDGVTINVPIGLRHDRTPLVESMSFAR